MPKPPLKSEEIERCTEVLLSLGEAPDVVPLVAWNAPAPGIGLRASALLSQIPYTYDGALNPEEAFPSGALDCDLQQVDLRKKTVGGLSSKKWRHLKCSRCNWSMRWLLLCCAVN